MLSILQVDALENQSPISGVCTVFQRIMPVGRSTSIELVIKKVESENQKPLAHVLIKFKDNNETIIKSWDAYLIEESSDNSEDFGFKIRVTRQANNQSALMVISELENRIKWISKRDFVPTGLRQDGI